MKLHRLRGVIKYLIREAIGPSTHPMDLGDDMNRILQYGGDLGLDDEDEDGNPQKHEGLGSSKKPSTYLGKSYLDDQWDEENEDSDFPTELSMHKQLHSEVSDPGYQIFPRFLNAGIDDWDTPQKASQEQTAWNMCQDLFSMVQEEFDLQHMSDPQFIDFVMHELAQEGTSDSVLVRIQYKLENSNGG